MTRQAPKKREIWEKYCPLADKKTVVEIIDVTKSGEYPHSGATSSYEATRADMGQILTIVTTVLTSTQSETFYLAFSKVMGKSKRTSQDVKEFEAAARSCDRDSWLEPSQDESFVIYLPDGCGPVIWALPLTDFMGKDEFNSNEYKFRKVANSWLDLNKDTSEKKNKNPELKNRQIRKDSTGKAKDNYRED